MGCGNDVQEPNAPQQAPTTAQSVSEWQQYLPSILATQQGTAKTEAQQQLELQQQYSLPMAQNTQAVNQALYPNTSRLQETLSGIALQGSTATSMPDWMRKQYMSDYNSQLGSNVGSNIGADYVSRGMQNQLFNQQQSYQTMGANLANRQPLATAQSPQYTNYASTFTPTGVGNFNMQGYNSYMPYYQNYQNQLGQLSMMPSTTERAGQAWGQYLSGQNYSGL